MNRKLGAVRVRSEELPEGSRRSRTGRLVNHTVVAGSAQELRAALGRLQGQTELPR